METIRFGGRSVAGFGVGDAAAPMTVADAARVSQGSWFPALAGAFSGVAGATAGFTAMAIVAGATHQTEDDALGLSVLGLLGGGVVGAGIGGALAAQFGRRQDRAAAVIAQAPPVV